MRLSAHLVRNKQMIVRNCFGGIVFYGENVLLIRNDKQEWGFPKGVLKTRDIKASELAKNRVKIEAGVDAEVIAPCGKTNYEYYSITRRKPVHNNVSWFVMKSETGEAKFNPDTGVTGAAFFPIVKALDIITYSQDKSLVMMAYQKYKDLD